MSVGCRGCVFAIQTTKRQEVGCRTRTGVVRSEESMGSGIVRMVILAVDSVDEICTVR